MREKVTGLSPISGRPWWSAHPAWAVVAAFVLVERKGNGMEEQVKRALEKDGLVDITTIGRRSGNAHRIEIAFHQIGDKIYIGGLPGRRDWYANIKARPEFTFHLKQSAQADMPARAIPIEDEPTRRRILAVLVEKWGREGQLEVFIERSPLIEVQLS
jgi:hypothetical protein